jgi:protein associated with RNAse G/E
MDEGERLKQKLRAPDQESWNNQMYRIRDFDELVYDTDPNLTNVLIGEDWKIYRIDFSRAFRLQKTLKYAPNLVRIDRRFFEKLKSLDEKELTQKTKTYLTKPEIQAVMARRDKIVAYFQMLIAQKGESEVLF